MSSQIIIIILLVFVIWLVMRKRENGSKVSVKKESDNQKNIGEDQVFKIQNRFEEKIQETYLPDSIDGKEIYIYENLMRPWYQKLSSQSRYNDSMTQKLRNDWVTYMNSLEDRSTYNFLSLEADDEAKRNSYRNAHIIASRKVFAIEDAFANSVGEDAQKELTRIRELASFSKFGRHGEIAPDGFQYDADEKLQKIK